MTFEVKEYVQNAIFPIL